MGIQFPEDYGGAGMSAVDYCICLEELARVDPSVSLSVAAHNGLGAAHIAMFGTDAQKQRYLCPARDRAAPGGLGAHRARLRQRCRGDAHHAPSGTATTWVLNGTKAFITHGSSADTMVVMAVTDRDKGSKGHLGVHRRARHAGSPRRQEGRQAGHARQRDLRGHPPELPGAGATQLIGERARASSRRSRCSMPAASASRRWRSGWHRAPTKPRAATRPSGSQFGRRDRVVPVDPLEAAGQRVARRGGTAAHLSRGLAQGPGPAHDARIFDGQAVRQRERRAGVGGRGPDSSADTGSSRTTRPRSSSATSSSPPSAKAPAKCSGWSSHASCWPPEVPASAPLAERVRSGDVRAIARAISLIEDEAPAAAALVRDIFPHTGRSLPRRRHRPAGRRQEHPRRQAHRRDARGRARRVGVVAVDPTSPFTGGAILGDRLRMQAHAEDAGRVHPLDGHTRPARGPGARDERRRARARRRRQEPRHHRNRRRRSGRSRHRPHGRHLGRRARARARATTCRRSRPGIMEIADIFVVNKADREGADRMVTAIESNLSLQSFGRGGVAAARS